MSGRSWRRALPQPDIGATRTPWAANACASTKAGLAARDPRDPVFATSEGRRSSARQSSRAVSPKPLLFRECGQARSAASGRIRSPAFSASRPQPVSLPGPELRGKSASPRRSLPRSRAFSAYDPKGDKAMTGASVLVGLRSLLRAPLTVALLATNRGRVVPARGPHSCWRGSAAKCSYSPREREKCANTPFATRAGTSALMVRPSPLPAVGVRWWIGI
jgi:hypothetical protein